jgi:cytochrome oxidase Cu insertion factor (SCO1/SenC/PrrC family)
LNRTRVVAFCTAAILLLLALPAKSRAQLPPSKNAPQVGQKTPDFTLPDSTGKDVKLSTLRSGEPEVWGATAEIPGYWILLIFYRGYW